MFDVAFSEILVIAVVALVVIGPEKLPKVARTLGALTGKLQRYIGNVRSEIEREIQFEELQQLQNELKARADAKVADIQQSLQEAKTQLDAEVNSAVGAVEEATQAPQKPTAPATQSVTEVAESNAGGNDVAEMEGAKVAQSEHHHPQLDLGLETKPQPKPSILE